VVTLVANDLMRKWVREVHFDITHKAIRGKAVPDNILNQYTMAYTLMSPGNLFHSKNLSVILITHYDLKHRSF